MEYVQKSFLKSAGLYLGFLAFFLVVYYSVFLYSFAFIDSYTNLFLAAHHEMHASVEPLYAGGRPLYALLFYVFYLNPDFESLKILRFVSISGIAALSLFFTYYLRKKTTFSFSVSLSIAAIIGLVPAFQVYAAWSVCAGFPWAALLAVLSFAVLDSKKFSCIIRVILSFILLCLSATIYQPAAMMFWVPASISWFIADKDFPSIKRLACAASVMLASLATDFLLTKTLPNLLYNNPGQLSRTVLVSNYAEKIGWFFSVPMKNALNLISIDKRLDIAIFVFLFIVFGMSYAFAGPRKDKIKKFALAFALLPATYFPNLIVAEHWASYRTQVALTSLLIIYTAIAFLALIDKFRVDKLKVPFLIVAVICAGYIAGHNVLVGFSRPQAQELKLVSLYFAAHNDFMNAKQIYLVPSSHSDTLAPVARYDEFGFPSSSAPYVLQGMTWLVLNAHHAPEADRIESAMTGPLRNAPNGATIVDFGNILRP